MTLDILQLLLCIYNHYYAFSSIAVYLQIHMLYLQPLLNITLPLFLYLQSSLYVYNPICNHAQYL